MSKLNVTPTIKIVKKPGITNYVDAICVWVGKDIDKVDNVDNMSWSLPLALATRFKKAVEDGKIMHSPVLMETSVTPVKTYVNCEYYNGFPMGKYMNADLKKIGY